MNRRQDILLALGLLLLVAVVTIVAMQFRTTSPRVSKDARCLTVATTFYPLTYLAERIGGADAHVVQLASGGIDVHDVQLSPQDIARVRDSQILVVNGQVDAWANPVRADAESHEVTVVSMLETLGLSTGTEDGGGPRSMGVNAHVWLDPVLVQREVSVIVDAFSRAAPSCADGFQRRGRELINELSALDVSLRDGLATCRSRDVIVSHDGFRRLTDRYRLIILPLTGSSPEEEPSPRRLAELAQQARNKGISVVFTEALVSSKLAETFAREINGRIIPLHPLEGLTAEEQNRGEDYFTIMRTNLAQLREGLGCTERSTASVR